MPLKENRDKLHDRAVQSIALARFAFPTPEFGSYKTYVNEPEPTMGVELPDGHIGYPDIVVVDNPGPIVKIVAEVETASTVNEDEALREWRPFAEVAPLYLYVPVGYAERAKTIVKKLRIPIVGLRTWRFMVGYEEVEIIDMETVPATPIEALIPSGLLKR